MDTYLVEITVENEEQLRLEAENGNTDSSIETLIHQELDWIRQSGLSSKMNPEFYVGIGTSEGIISYVHTGTDIEAIKKLLEEDYSYVNDEDNKFDPECDDARIFNNEGKEVFSMFSSMTDHVFTPEVK